MRRLPLLACALCAPLTLALPACAASRPDPVQMLTKADADRDGAVSLAEFRQARAGQFSKLDRNGDGAISSADAPRLAKRGKGGERMAEMTKAFDANGDGRVTRDEFVDGPALVFGRADANGDQTVSPAELDAFRKAVAARKS